MLQIDAVVAKEKAEQPESAESMRLDKWLWAARFFKTRSLAANAVDAGKVIVNGAPAKRSRLVRIGDTVTLLRTPFAIDVLIRALADLRGPASVAARLYEETDESRKARERLAAQLESERGGLVVETGGRPTKKDRRRLDRMKPSW